MSAFYGMQMPWDSFFVCLSFICITQNAKSEIEKCRTNWQTRHEKSNNVTNKNLAERKQWTYAHLEAVPIAVTQAWFTPHIMRYGFLRLRAKQIPGSMISAWMVRPKRMVTMYIPSCWPTFAGSSSSRILPAIKNMIPMGEYLKVNGDNLLQYLHGMMISCGNTYIELMISCCNT